MASDPSRFVPLTCHGHSRPVTHLNFSHLVDGDQYYLISACKDNNPMLRDGITGDWIGTFIGHKGAVWSSRLSSDATLAATGAADFKAKIWDPQTGECLHTLEHDHIVKAVAFPIQRAPQFVATGGNDRKFRIFDLSHSTNGAFIMTNGSESESMPAHSFELGPGGHTAGIKSIVWNNDYNILTTAADDMMVRWWDLRMQESILTVKTDAPITSCELSTNEADDSNPGIISVAAGKSCYFFVGDRPGQLLKKVDFDHDVASVAINPNTGRYVTGGRLDFWARVYDLDSGAELGK